LLLSQLPHAPLELEQEVLGFPSSFYQLIQLLSFFFPPYCTELIAETRNFSRLTFSSSRWPIAIVLVSFGNKSKKLSLKWSFFIGISSFTILASWSVRIVTC